MNGTDNSVSFRLPKISVTCITCGTSDSFYSTLSLSQFKSKHPGHEIVDGDGQARALDVADSNVLPLEKPRETTAGNRLSRLLVELVTFPALPSPVFQIQGFKDDSEPAFTITMHGQEDEKVRALLTQGHYVDLGFSDLLYTWEPTVIECDRVLRSKLRIGLRSEGKDLGDLRHGNGHASEAGSSTVARAIESLLEVPRSDEPAPKTTPVVSLGPPPVEAAREAPRNTPWPPNPPPESRPTEPSKPTLVPAKPTQNVDNRVSNDAAQRPKDEDAQLLVSKSWYIQKGEKNYQEAARVSKILRAFRWKIEPAYTIGVILDDMLSIESSKNQISRALIRDVEGGGYKMTAVVADQGKMVAWFKRGTKSEGNAGESAMVDEAREDESDVL